MKHPLTGLSSYQLRARGSYDCHRLLGSLDHLTPIDIEGCEMYLWLLDDREVSDS